MKLFLRTIMLTTALVCIGTTAMAQQIGGNPDDDSYSYHRVYTGPDVDRTAMPPAAVPMVAHEIPTIQSASAGRAREDVSFLTGGVGDDERAVIEASKASYNLRITNARVDGAFVEDTDIVIHEKSGRQDEMLSVNAGPLLYVQLPPGDYVLDASHNGELKQQAFTIGKTKTFTLRWKNPAPDTNW